MSGVALQAVLIAERDRESGGLAVVARVEAKVSGAATVAIASRRPVVPGPLWHSMQATFLALCTEARSTGAASDRW